MARKVTDPTLVRNSSRPSKCSNDAASGAVPPEAKLQDIINEVSRCSSS